MSAVPQERGRTFALPHWATLPVIAGGAIILFWIVVGLTIPLWSPYDPTMLAGPRFAPPSAEHWLGTDALGRDVFTRTLYGVRHSLPIAGVVIAMAVLIGCTLGAIAGFVGGILGDAIMRLVDVTLSFPPILLAMAVTAALGPGLDNAAIAMVIVWWPIYARLMRAQVLSVREREHVEAAVAAGATPRRVLTKHILPLCWSPIIVNATMDFGQVVLLAASLSFIGLGAVPPTPEWGQMISDGALHFYRWWIAAGPGLAILSIVLGFNFLGDGLRDLLDPEERMTEPLLKISDLNVTFAGRGGRRFEAVSGVDLEVGAGELHGVVGESGSGKSVTMMAVMRLLAPTARVTGSVRLDGEELLALSGRRMRKVRGARIGFIFQDPMTALNPLLTVGDQLAEAVRIHAPGTSRAAARARAVELLHLVAIPMAEKRAGQYPHEFSGGMRQRVVIAMAMANEPDLLIADEPTTALDVTIQAQIMELLERLRAEKGVGIVLVTHDLGVVAGAARALSIMYAGRIVEHGLVDDVFAAPRHPYTQGLLESLPQPDRRVERLRAIPGAPPAVGARPEGCPFHPRCFMAIERCRVERPLLRPVGRVAAACHRAEEMAEGAREEAVSDA